MGEIHEKICCANKSDCFSHSHCVVLDEYPAMRTKELR